MKIVPKHDRIQLREGKNIDPKEHCDCIDCIQLRKRRNAIFNKWHHKINRWFNNNL